MTNKQNTSLKVMEKKSMRTDRETDVSLQERSTHIACTWQLKRKSELSVSNKSKMKRESFLFAIGGCVTTSQTRSS